MLRPTRQIRLRAVAEIALWLLPGALIALLGDPLWGVLAMLAGALYQLYRHIVAIDSLVAWARSPLGTPVPIASGVWDLIFSEINRRSRLMKEQRERLSLALDRFVEAGRAMPDGVIYMGPGNVIDWANPRAEEHFGIVASRDAGAALTNLVRDPDFVAYLEAGEFSEPLIMCPLRQQGLTLMVQLVPYAESRCMLLSRDISHLERLETMRRDFVANVSHELRTPLTVVLGFIETLADDDGLSADDRRHYLGLAREQAERMHRLILDLLVLSALETGAPSPTEDQVDMPDLLDRVLTEGNVLSAGRHRLTLEIEGPHWLRGSVKELHSAFANLVSNAVRYSDPSGHIRLRWRAVDGGAEFSVQDQGDGIDARHIPRLTERFYRIDRGRSRESGGTGLGLAIVKHVLGRHQGRLDIESTPGVGSTFRAILPARRVLSSASDEAA
ncbi:MAG: phosphate regulon sensor histidine kinase PhoR [Zoogloeaceae bacterium]|nr:phosphate regulon sensor histidine kinase PhoR [Rhodocyclaceae bacterium]MCP5237667.1 phosphate regulon sensor histidine kinase PhoR [Zoogloeaceae bacterium]